MLQPGRLLVYGAAFILWGFFLKQATALACSPSSPTAAVGTVDGYVYFLNILDVESPQMIHQAFLSQSPVKIVT